MSKLTIEKKGKSLNHGANSGGNLEPWSKLKRKL
jgi:hypothetical protein